MVTFSPIAGKRPPGCGGRHPFSLRCTSHRRPVRISENSGEKPSVASPSTVRARSPKRCASGNERERVPARVTTMKVKLLKRLKTHQALPTLYGCNRFRFYNLPSMFPRSALRRESHPGVVGFGLGKCLTRAAPSSSALGPYPRRCLSASVIVCVSVNLLAMSFKKSRPRYPSDLSVSFLSLCVLSALCGRTRPRFLASAQHRSRRSMSAVSSRVCAPSGGHRPPLQHLETRASLHRASRWRNRSMIAFNGQTSTVGKAVSPSS